MLIPTFNSEPIIDKFLENLRALAPQPDRYIFLENNSNDKTLEKIWEAPLPAPKEVLRIHFASDAVQRCKNKYDTIAHVRELLLTRARCLNPDFAIFLDDDIIIKSLNMIESLTLWNVDIIGAPFLRWFPSGVYLASKWKSPRNGKFRLYKRVRKALDTPLMTSAGCMCLSRKAIQDRRLHFYPIEPTEYDHVALASEDFGFCILARKLGYEIYLDGTVFLDHYIMLPNRLTKPWTDQIGKKEFQYA